MKPLHWDAINPITGRPFTWDDPNLFWGDPSYYLEPGDPGFVPYPGMPPAPKPKKKTFHRKRKPLTPTNPEPQPEPNTMSTFKYNVAPLAAGGFTTRAVRGAQADQTAIAAAIATTAGVTPEQVETVIQTFFDKILSCAAGCDWSPDFFGCISFRPTSGGSQAAPDAFHNADDINADVAISLSAEKIRTWRAGLSLESLGEVGKVTPLIDSILSQDTGAVDTYAPGSLIQLRGNNLKLNKADVNQGVFFKAGAAAEVRATVYGTMDPTAISVLVPATLSGPLTVRVAAFINGSVRSYTYTNLIHQ